MQLGIGGFAGLAAVATWQGMPVVRRTPLDLVLAAMFAGFAVSTLASGHPFAAPGWGRLWIVVGYFGVFWWLEDERAAVRFVGWLLLPAPPLAPYRILQPSPGAVWYRAPPARQPFVPPPL